MPRKPKPGDRIRIIGGSRHAGRTGVYKRDTDNGKKDMGYVLLLGDTTGERRLWISSMQVIKETEPINANAGREMVKLAIELSGLTIEEVNECARTEKKK